MWHNFTEWIYPNLLTVVGFLFALFLFSRILSMRTSPEGTLAWMLAVIFIPYIGVPFYLLFGGRKIKKIKKKKENLYPSGGEGNIPPSHHGGDIEKILLASGAPPARKGNFIEFIPTGEGAYEKIMAMIHRGEKSIHIVTFILGRDEVSREILSALAEKARQGVQVRLLVDALGSFWSKGRFLKDFRQAGGMVGSFMPVLPLQRKWSAHLRNHRKMVLVDGQEALLGGMNISKEYMGPEPDPQRWADFVLHLEGPALDDLESIFSSDWHFATGEEIESEPYDSSLIMEKADKSLSQAVIQVVGNGPDVEREPLYDSLLGSFFKARKRIWILSPYFIPDENLTRCLSFLAQGGVEVKIVIPQSSDLLFVDLARSSYLRQVYESGCKILAYQPKMMHAKIIIVDDFVAIMGSANMDIRSLYLNYEIATFLYNSDYIEDLAEIVQSEYMSRCVDWHPRPEGYFRGWMEDITRLMGPLL